MLSDSPTRATREEAITWFLKSSAGGNAAADYSLALAYAFWKEIARDHDKSATYLIQAIGRNNPRAIDDMKKSWREWPRPVLIAVQDQLRQTGYYKGASDGVFGPMTFAAIDALAAGRKS
jgi:TPR repeat protein